MFKVMVKVEITITRITPEGCNGGFYKKRKQADGNIFTGPARDCPGVPKDPKT